MKPIYMDNNATTRVAPEVVQEMLPYFSDLYGNPSSMHVFGGNVGAKLKAAREHVATMLGALPEEILFTSCGTESDSTAIHAAIRAHPEKKHIILIVAGGVGQLGGLLGAHGLAGGDGGGCGPATAGIVVGKVLADHSFRVHAGHGIDHAPVVFIADPVHGFRAGAL